MLDVVLELEVVVLVVVEVPFDVLRVVWVIVEDVVGTPDVVVAPR